MSNWNPIRRSPLKKKPRRAYESAPWRRKKIRLDAQGMLGLRQDVLYRSGLRCENSIDGERCWRRISWHNFHLAHIVSRGRGGSDSMENCLAACWECHDADTLNRRKLQPHKDFITIP